MRAVIYHSREWEALVELGWRTHIVEELVGQQIAFMIYCPARRY
jgi:hypothetical protein